MLKRGKAEVKFSALSRFSRSLLNKIARTAHFKVSFANLEAVVCFTQNPKTLPYFFRLTV